MTLEKSLLDLLEHLDSSNTSIHIGWTEVQQWDEGVLDKFIDLGLIASSSSAQILECRGCEYRCFMDVITDNHNIKQPRAFIVCDVPEMQSEMGRMEIPINHLKQWQSSVKQLANVIHGLLAMQGIADTDKAVIRLGMLQGKGGRRWVTLLNQPLALEINEIKTPVNELLFVDGGELVVDRIRIDELLDTKPLAVSKTYTPSTDKREIKKLNTQAKYQDWQDAYISLKKKHKTITSKKWFSRKISRMSIAQECDPETIRKHLQ